MSEKFNTRRPFSYHEPKQICGNCKHVFFVLEYEECTSYFCMYKSRRRPLCGSSLMGENFDSEMPKDRDEKYRDRWWSRKMRAWEKWAEKRRVERMGTCAHYRYEAPMKLIFGKVYGSSSDKPIWKR